MEITKQRSGDFLDVKVTGRLDAYWADHLAAALEEAIRAGADRIRLDMADVAYMSSAGIRILVKLYKQLKRIEGSFTVTRPSEPVKSVLELAGLGDLLASPATARAETAEPGRASRRLERGGGRFDVFELAPGARLRCEAVGDPERLRAGRYGAEHCRTIRFPAPSFGLGVGAFGGDFADCRGRFGEFVAAAGAAAYLPTDGSNVPDYLVSAGALVPELEVLYALRCEGAFSHFARFEPDPERGRVAQADLARAALESVEGDLVAMIAVAESAGLVGAALRRSPAVEGVAGSPFRFPGIRDWLSFTPERAFHRNLALVVGVAARTESGKLARFLRPLESAARPAGHFHAAAFSYRPLPKGVLSLESVVPILFEAETLGGVLHLLCDDRPIDGVGQSEFGRGACWIGTISEVEERASR